MFAPLISDTAYWKNCAQELADLLRDIAQQEVLTRCRNLLVNQKTDGSLLSEADTAVQRALARALPAIFAAPLLGEESPVEDLSALWNNGISQATALWIADPIDGTTNFVAGLPWYAISVALVHQGYTVVGVTYAPALGKLWQASLGGGAFMNGERIKLGSSPSTLRSCLIGVDMTYLPSALRRSIADCSPSGIGRKSDQLAPWRGWRSLGASTLEWCALASGQIQAYVHGGQMPWDATAGRLILAEAGGHSSPLAELDSSLTYHQQSSCLSPIAYAAAAPGVWKDWQTWLKQQLG